MVVGLIACQVAVLSIPFQQALALQKAVDKVGDSVCHLGQLGAGGRHHPLKLGVAIGLIEVYAVQEHHGKMMSRNGRVPNMMLTITVKSVVVDSHMITVHLYVYFGGSYDRWDCVRSCGKPSVHRFVFQHTVQFCRFSAGQRRLILPFSFPRCR
jgi:hypothetical protein